MARGGGLEARAPARRLARTDTPGSSPIQATSSLARGGPQGNRTFHRRGLRYSRHPMDLMGPSPGSLAQLNPQRRRPGADLLDREAAERLELLFRGVALGRC